MNDSLKKKWIIVSVVWCGVLLISIFNFTEIEYINDKKLKNEVLKMDKQYVIHNSDEIDQIFQEEALMSHTIDSIGIGILVVENQLRQMSTRFNLKDMRLEARSDDNGSQEIPLGLFVSGSLTDMVSMLMQIETACPFLAVNRLDWSKDLNRSKLQFKLLLKYRYVLLDSDQEA